MNIMNLKRIEGPETWPECLRRTPLPDVVDLGTVPRPIPLFQAMQNDIGEVYVVTSVSVDGESAHIRGMRVE